MADKLIYVVTCGDEKEDKATIPFAPGSSALAMDAEAIIILQSTGVFLGKKGYACEPCIRARNISADDLLEHIEIVSDPTLVNGYLEAKNVVVY